MKYPTMVYLFHKVHEKALPHQCPGGTYDFLGVANPIEMKAALEAGWSVTLPEAMGRGEGPTPSLEDEDVVASTELEVLGDYEPPTRAELEKQATELGIKFKKSTTDEELNLKINEALEG